MNNFTFIDDTFVIEMHFLCIMVICMLYVAMLGKRRRQKSNISFRMTLVYMSCVIVLVTDALSALLDGIASTPVNMLINVIYFIFTTVGVIFWMLFCLESLQVKFVNPKTTKERVYKGLLILPSAVMFLLAITAPLNGWVFTVVDGCYVRGPLFALNPVINLSYLLAATAVALVYSIREKRPHYRKQNFLLLVYSVPVILCGILQAVVGADFNCLGVTLGLFFLYAAGISNTTRENSDLIYSLSRSFDAAFRVDMDVHTIKTLRVGNNYKETMNRLGEESSYEARIQHGLDYNVVPEDRDTVSVAFNIDNVRKRLAEDSAYTLVYRVKTKQGEVVHHRAMFMLAEASDGKNEFLLCIQSVDLEKLVSERTIELAEKNDRLEKINEDIITAVANMVEARNSESGEHILRVKEYTHMLAVSVMKNYPEYNLDSESVRFITSASALHDIGKIMISDSILLKPGKLTDEEFEMMKTHSLRGCEILKNFSFNLSDTYLKYANEICRWHHEKYDGGGYPDGLAGEEIPVSAQIVSIADCLDALMSKRVYKASYTAEDAIDMVLRGECGVFSPKLMDCLAKSRQRVVSIASNQITEAYQHADMTSDINTLQDLEILLVDGDEKSRAIHRDILESNGSMVVEAGNGKEALKEFRNMNKCDAIIMDIIMPEMSGAECTRNIREMEASLADKIPIIGLSAARDQRVVEDFLASGADACMEKPLMVSRLARILLGSMRERSMNMEKKLADSIRIATTDSLTRVKNITAYGTMISELTEEMRSTLKPAFAVVICDLNDLKHYNDTYGHEAGDRYIQENCEIICEIFSHSPVYRIGGDEFAVILKGSDYNNRDEKMKQLMVGQKSIAAGISVYDPERDESVSAVVKRADKNMYDVKYEMKGGNVR